MMVAPEMERKENNITHRVTRGREEYSISYDDL